MRYLISGEDLATLLIVAARRMDADVLGALVQRVYGEPKPMDAADGEDHALPPMPDGWGIGIPTAPAKPE